MSESLDYKSHECRCDCHSDSSVMHYVPCCSQCRHCELNIERGYMDLHLKNWCLKKAPAMSEEDWDNAIVGSGHHLPPKFEDKEATIESLRSQLTTLRAEKEKVEKERNVLDEKLKRGAGLILQAADVLGETLDLTKKLQTAESRVAELEKENTHLREVMGDVAYEMDKGAKPEALVKILETALNNQPGVEG